MKAMKFLPVLVIALLAGCGQKSTPTTEAPAEKPAPAAAAAAPAASEAPAAAAAPAAAPAAAEPAAAPAASAAASASAGDLALGEKTFGANCTSCHGSGVLGAPKVGDKAAWGPRIAKGKDVLYQHALTGFNMMPPKGGNAGLKDEEVKAVVDYLVSKAS